MKLNIEKLTKFHKKMRETFSPEEIALAYVNVYLNYDYINYIIDYDKGNYTKCFNFLKKNRHLLTIENTPENMLGYAKLNIKVIKNLIRNDK